MAQIVLTVVGNAIGGPIGGAIGGAIGGMIDRELFGPKHTPPAVADLSAPKIEYGSEIPRLAGTNVTAGALGWMSEKRPTAVEAGGKGGGGEVVGYTYTADIIWILGQHDQEPVWKAVAIPRVWRNGELVYSARAGADPETYAASDGTTAWDSIELMDGSLSQLPPDVYEAAVGTLLAKGWRGQNCVLLRNARFGSSTVPPAFKFEVVTAGTMSTACVPYDSMGNAIWLAGADQLVTVGVWNDYAYKNWVVAGTSATLSGFINSYYTSEFTFQNQNFDIFSDYAASGGCRYAEIYFPTENTSSSNDTGWLGIATDETLATFWGLRYGGFAITDANTSGSNIGASWSTSGTVIMLAYKDGNLWIGKNGSWTGGGLLPPDTDPATGINPTHSGILTAMRLFVRYFAGLPDVTVEIRTGDEQFTYTPPTGFYAWNRLFTSAELVVPGTVDLADLVSAHCRRANIPAALLDVSALVGIPVRGAPSAGGVRAALEQLGQVHHFTWACDDKLRAVLRGGASVATIPFDDMGAGFDQAAEEPVEIDWGNDNEVPRKLSLTYINPNADHDAGSVIGDRGTGNIQRLPTAQVGVVMTPSEAQKVADAWALDGRGAATTIKLPLTEFHAQRQPTDVLTLIDRQGISYRARIVAESWSLGVHEHELVLDDASVFTQAGIATDNTTPNINVPLPAVPQLILLDIPILRDADNGYGLYACVTADGSFKGCSVRRSRDGGTTYTEVGKLANRAIAGTATALGASTTWGWDNANTMTVTLSPGAGGTLSSATKATVEASADLNVAAVGVPGRWEIVRFASATLIAPNTYLLSGFLRGQFGTEHNRANHAAGDTFVLLRTTGMIRIDGEAGDVGVERKYKAVPNLGSEAAAAAVAFTTGEQGLEPYAPVDLRKTVADGATVVAWNRRSRLSTPAAYTSQPPLGEASESYDVELFDATDALILTETVTGPQWSAASASAFENFLVPMNRMMAVGGEQVGVREDAAPNFRFVRQTIAGGLIAESPLLGSLVYQTARDGDELYAATADITGAPSTYINGKLKRVTRTALGTIAATYTAATAGDIHGVAFDGTNIWVSEFYSGNLRKLNKTTLASVATYVLSTGMRNMLHDAGSLWICRDYDNEVIKWSIATQTELLRFSTVEGPSALLMVGGLLFVRGSYFIGVYNASTGALVASHAATHTGTDQLYEIGAYVIGMAGYGVILLDKATGAEVSRISSFVTYAGTAYTFMRSVAGVDGSTFYMTLGGPGLSNQTIGFDLDAADLSGHTVKVYQNSAATGRGHVAELAL